MLAEVGEGVARVAQPLRRRVEGVAGIAVAVADVGLAHQAPVEGLHIAAAPGRAGVEADLAEAVEDLAAAPAQQHRIVAIEPAAFHPLAGQRQQRRVGHAVGEDEGLARRQAAAQVDAAARRAGAVEIELDAVGGEVEDLAAAVVELQRLVVAAAFDILGDDQARRRWPPAGPAGPGRPAGRRYARGASGYSFIGMGSPRLRRRRAAVPGKTPARRRGRAG